MKVILAALIAVTSLPVAAIPLEQALELCRAEQNALRRLSCYDAIPAVTATTVTPNNTATPATTTAAAPAAAVAATNTTVQKQPAADFGIEHRKVDEDAPDQLYLSVKEVRYSPRKELIVEFDNGQIWRQNGTDYYKIAAGEQHYIKRGALNSFFLGNDINNRTIRVRREQ
ncbi:hypothetical protein SAMN05660691_03060 [Rheinheimera pacifica]|uniref:Uncharacterized protein n=1 Tax=Rheinheimera pacifica TaxID=173990 RepID=A0A1H6N281_9GAMM|nr:hypothetical protein [Rheinheimera pacifica]SEI04562.1 hypothetical protein SAMN05660691_03060 [Rheinheimera pacifica]